MGTRKRAAERPEYFLTTNGGIYCVQIGYGAGRKRESLGTTDLALAETRFADWQETRRRLNVRNTAMTISAILDGYLADRLTEVKAPERLMQSVKVLRPFFGHLYCEHLLKTTCREYREMRQQAGRRPGTIWTELTMLSAALTWAARQNPPWIPYAPKVYRGKQSPPRERYLIRTENEAERLLAGAVAPHVKLFIEMGLGTAARAEAILDLTWDRVDLQRGLITLQDPEEDQTSKGRAVVPITKTLYAALAEAKKAALSDYVIEYQGERVRTIQGGFEQAAKRAGLKGVTPHVLRHTCGVWMAEAGKPMEEIAQFMGHSSAQITRTVYARYSPDYLRGAASALEREPATPAKPALRVVA